MKALRVRDRFGHELHVEVVADGRHRAGLVVAQEIARAAYLEVSHGDLEATAERGVVANRAQSLIGRLGEHLIDRMEQVGVGALPTSSDATTQLVQLTQTETFGAIHDQRVNGR